MANFYVGNQDDNQDFAQDTISKNEGLALPLSAPATKSQLINLLLIAAFGALFDQLTKLLSVKVLASSYDFIALTPFLNIVHRLNTGIAFSLGDGFGEAGRWFFIIVALVVSLALFIWFVFATTPLRTLAIGLLIGGAIGNTIDRLRLGGVIDFIDFHLYSWHYPTFNLADSLIFIGVGLLIWDIWRIDTALAQRESQAQTSAKSQDE